MFRSFPFFEHRTWAQVLETEELETFLRRNPRYMNGGQRRRLQSLLSRATFPDPAPEPSPECA